VFPRLRNLSVTLEFLVTYGGLQSDCATAYTAN